MAQFNVYESGGMITASQAGWSWGGFLFGVIWAAVNRLWFVVGATVLFQIVFFSLFWRLHLRMYVTALLGDTNTSASLFVNIIFLAVQLVYGLFGNQWLGDKVSAGGMKVDTIDASSKEGAVMMYMQKKQLMSNSAQQRNY